MRTKFDEQLNQLNQELMHMGTMIEEQIQKAVVAFMKQDTELARIIMDNDTDVDREEKKIENICFNLLMQQQPVARDLRTISAAMKMVTDMERIGDHAADISEMTILIADNTYVKQLDHIQKMASETVQMLMKSIQAYVDKDMEAAKAIIKNDDVIDELFLEVKKDLIAMIHANADCGEQATDLLMVAKYFERIGDHATNIAEWVIFALDDKNREG
ncbi:phosphate signaling complex protein PhoU [Roseburia sp. MUC/MUC-530-WT-4D]|uniref:Phosphate-specific transport system accessory protein PhoU n=1 Tax=Roseburia porci TaxID=2605790 RepID=A0A6L5YU98_9FIRM|nr:phosphate signaling complex protein PhoU [Roseburia porci]MCI5516861.1 phosphate signaling complex protein PhoU [Roseburia sp.]MDD6742648.1 phosphate signaling complex protein PhoU [Roseburia porci]MST75546.1 phosphate signaling complex protein PhoU [Roseburia porci]